MGMAKHFTAITLHHYLLSAYYMPALSPDARGRVYNRWVSARYNGYRGLFLFSLVSSQFAII